MRPDPRKLGTLAAAAVGLGCGLFGPAEPPEGFEPATASYACQDFVLEVNFWHPDLITIAGRGEVAELERMPSRSGERYRGGGFTFWTTGADEALLELPAGQVRDCRRVLETPAS